MRKGEPGNHLAIWNGLIQFTFFLMGKKIRFSNKSLLGTAFWNDLGLSSEVPLHLPSVREPGQAPMTLQSHGVLPREAPQHQRQHTGTDLLQSLQPSQPSPQRVHSQEFKRKPKLGPRGICTPTLTDAAGSLAEDAGPAGLWPARLCSVTRRFREVLLWFQRQKTGCRRRGGFSSTPDSP